MLDQIIHPTLTLCRLKLRLLVNSIKNWGSIGKILAALFGLGLAALAIGLGAADLVDGIAFMPLGPMLIEWLITLLVLYVVLLVFTGDLITGHSINTGQMSSDFGFLHSLPIPSISLIVVKLFERIISDYIGMTFLLSGLIGIMSREGFYVGRISFALLIYLQISLASGLLINLFIIALRRFFKTSTINNAFSLLGYISAFSTLIPYLLITNFPEQSLYWLMQNQELFASSWLNIFLPFYWLAQTLLELAPGQAFAFWSLSWALFMFTGLFVFYGLIRLNWLDYNHSATRPRKSSRRRILTGFFRKEFLLLKGDYNMLINAIFMPITIIILNLYIVGRMMSLTAINSITNMIFGAIVYFCLFGPVNSIGAEGKSVNLLESLPITPAGLLLRKTIFWGIVAEMIAVPAVIAALRVAGFEYSLMGMPVLVTSIFTLLCVFSSVCVSAIFPNYHSKILQQRSTFGAKIAAMFLMVLVLPIKGLSLLEIYNLLVFVVILSIAYMSACRHIFYRLDAEGLSSKSMRSSSLLLPVMIFTAIDLLFRQLFLAIIPNENMGLWSWLLASMAFVPLASIFIMQCRKTKQSCSNLQTAANEDMSDSSPFSLVAVVPAVASIAAINYWYPNAFSVMRGQVGGLMNDLANLGLSFATAATLLTLVFVAVWVVAEYICKFLLLKAKGASPAAVAAASAAPLLVLPSAFALPAVIFSGISCLMTIKKSEPRVVICFSAACIATLVLFLLLY